MATDEREHALVADTSEESDPATESDGGITRRRIIALGGSAVLSTAIASGVVRGAAQKKRARIARPSRFFTRHEFAMVDELAELIIPTDDHSPGARAAGAAAYIDFRLSESSDDEKAQWREGLKLVDSLSREINGNAFLKATSEQRIELLTRISQNEKKPEKPEEKFFNELKASTANAYYSSKIGIHQEMKYKGNSYQKEFAGYDAT